MLHLNQQRCNDKANDSHYIDQNIQETIKITKKDRNSLEAIKLKIREAAESGLGVIRNEKDLKAAIDTFAAMEKKLQKFNLEKYCMKWKVLKKMLRGKHLN